MVVYGLWVATLCLSSFTVVVYVFGNGNLGENCNNTFTPACKTVYRARATCFACLTWLALFLAWELTDFRGSFFRLRPWSKLPYCVYRIWRNQFLFWAVIAGFVTIFPTLYIPVINHEVFKQDGISWEWGIVFVAALLFFSGVETWKGIKRFYFRRRERRNLDGEDLEARTGVRPSSAMVEFHVR